MLSYGFFNAVDGDRTYNAESFNTFFEGLISTNGIFEGVGEGFKVTPGDGLTVNVGTGKAMVDSVWVKNDSTINLTIDPTEIGTIRYDLIGLLKSSTNRNVILEVVKGDPAETEAEAKLYLPDLERYQNNYEIGLAYIKIVGGQTTIYQHNINDLRYDTSKCGVITGLVEQVDTTNLYNQYKAQFDHLSETMTTWQTQQQANFNAWMETLTDTLNVDTYITRTIANVTTTEDNTSIIDIPTELNYENRDILDVFIGGVLFVLDMDYSIGTNDATGKPAITIRFGLDTDQPVTFICWKSKIGFATT